MIYRHTTAGAIVMKGGFMSAPSMVMIALDMETGKVAWDTKLQDLRS